LHQFEPGRCIKHTCGIQGDELTEAVSSDQRRLATLSTQFINDQRLHHEERWLSVSRVVQIGRILPIP